MMKKENIIYKRVTHSIMSEDIYKINVKFHSNVLTYNQTNEWV